MQHSMHSNSQIQGERGENCPLTFKWGNAIPQLLGVFWQYERRMLIAAKLVMTKNSRVGTCAD